MQKTERYKGVIEYFSRNMPGPKTELNYRSPYELIVSVILSAQCTDKRVNEITPSFFSTFPTQKKLSKATHKQVYDVIKSCSYPNNKAKNLIGMAKMLIEQFDGIMPDDIDELQKLPGVGRKTANVIASVLYQKPVIAVDTHVFRVSARIGLTTGAKTPLATEKQLSANIPESLRHIAHHWLIIHGRYICVSRKPKCEICGITKFCEYYALNQKNKS